MNIHKLEKECVFEQLSRIKKNDYYKTPVVY